MLKYVLFFVLLSTFYFPLSTFAQYPVLTAELFSSPPAQTVNAGVQNVDVARIRILATEGDVFLKGFYLNTDIPGGLANITEIFIYDVSDNTKIGTYPAASENPNLVEVSTNIFIGNGRSKTYLLRANFNSSARGDIRVGFSSFKFTTEATPSLVNVPIYGNTISLPQVSLSPSPAVSGSPAPSPSTTPSPERVTPVSRGFVSLPALGINEGDTISAAGLPAGQAGSDDPDIYIPNEYGYKRLFLNPVIFGFYGHLGGFPAVKSVLAGTRDTLVTSGLFKNCETNDAKVYGLETTGEDTGVIHWINTTGEQAVADDPEFFKKVFCINNNEFNWYTKNGTVFGANYTSVNQIPDYSR